MNTIYEYCDNDLPEIARIKLRHELDEAYEKWKGILEQRIFEISAARSLARLEKSFDSEFIIGC